MSQSLKTGRRHASDLLPALESMLERLDVKPNELEAVIVGTGPGSYTGLRVGVATALGLARGSGARLQAVPSFEALALGHLQPGERAAVLLDARSRQIYRAVYERADEGIIEHSAPSVASQSEWREDLGEVDVILCDEATIEAAELNSAERETVRLCAGPHAREVLELGIGRLETHGAIPADQLEPLYLRPFAANLRRR